MKDKLCVRTGLVLTSCILLASCANDGTIKKTVTMEEGDLLLTSADVRFVLRESPAMVEGGVVKPKFIICAEPSPDIAKVISSASNIGLAATANLPQGISPEAAAAFSREQAAAMAQLGERVATIQLLRDGLYRACEAYANGALSSTAYAVLLSRYDDTMITLLQSELAAGAFGRTLAALTGEATGEATATLETSSSLKEHSEILGELTESVKQSSDVESSLKEARKHNDALQRELDESKDEVGNFRDELSAAEARDASQETQNNLKERIKTSEARKTSLETSLEHASKSVASLESSHASKTREVKDLERRLEDKLAAAAKGTAKAGAIAAGAITPGQQKVEIAKVLHEMQREYLNNINGDALEVACIVALDKPPGTQLTSFAEICKKGEFFAKGINILENIIQEKFALKKMELAPIVKALNSKGAVSRRRQDVLMLQFVLNKVDNAGIAQDGIYGKETTDAVRRFQAANGLKADGNSGPATMEKLLEKL